jgi:alpha-glucuronidase
MDRTVATGTGYIGQYPAEVQKLFEPLNRCPDNLLLFFHHVPYTYVLHSGKTVIQHVYDSHYDGADRARDFIAQWQTLSGHIDCQASRTQRVASENKSLLLAIRAYHEWRFARRPGLCMVKLLTQWKFNICLRSLAQFGDFR